MASRCDRILSELLLLRHRRGDVGAMKELVCLWERPLFYYIRRLVRSEEDAWDTLQQVWLQVIRKVSKLRQPGAFPVWLYKIAHNTAISQWRKAHVFEPLDEDRFLSSSQADSTSATYSAFDARDIHNALGKLKATHREALTLHFLESFSIKEISEITEVPEGTVKSRLHYAKAAMRGILEQEQESNEE